jgi:hypothetical protein
LPPITRSPWYVAHQPSSTSGWIIVDVGWLLRDRVYFVSIGCITGIWSCNIRCKHREPTAFVDDANDSCVHNRCNIGSVSRGAICTKHTIESRSTVACGSSFDHTVFSLGMPPCVDVIDAIASSCIALTLRSRSPFITHRYLQSVLQCL